MAVPKKPAPKAVPKTAAPKRPVPYRPKTNPNIKNDPKKYNRQQLVDLANQYYGQADPNKINKLLANLNYNADTLDHVLYSIKKGAATTDPEALRAGRAVSTEVDPVLSELRNQSTQRGQLGERQKADLTTLYDILSKNLSANTSRGQQAIQGAQQQVGSQYDRLQQQLGSTYGGATGAVGNELSRLGLGEAQPAATQELSRDQQFLQGLAGSDRATAQSNIATGASNYEQLAGLMQGSAGFEKTAQVADAQQRTADAMQELQTRIGNIESTRPNKVSEALSALKDARAQAETDAQQRAFENAILQAKLGLEGQRVDISRGQLNLNQQKVNLESRKTESQLRRELQALQPGSIEYQEKQAAIDLKKSQTLANLNKLKEKDTQNQAKGFQAAQDYIFSSNAQPQVKQALADHIGNAMQWETRGQAIQAIQRDIQRERYPREIASLLFTAIDKAYGSRAK